jgi:hypothetical protein
MTQILFSFYKKQELEIVELWFFLPYFIINKLVVIAVLDSELSEGYILTHLLSRNLAVYKYSLSYGRLYMYIYSLLLSNSLLSGGELATYSTNLLDMVDMFGDSEAGEWSSPSTPESNNVMDVSLSELSTPQKMVLSPSAKKIK